MPEAALEFRSFTGLNVRDTSARIKASEMVECQNFDLGIAGDLAKRTGFKHLNGAGNLGASTVVLLGYFYTEAFSQLLARVGSSVYYSSDGGATWTVCASGPHGNVEFGVQYTNKFYLVRRDSTILEWNGTTMTAIAGSPMGSHGFVYKDRLFVLNTYATGTLSSRLYFSSIADFSATGWPGTNFIDVATGDGDFLTCSAQISDVLTVFKARSTWLLYVAGDPTTWTLRNASPAIGCVSRHTVKEIESQLYFVGARGVYRTDGTSFNEISEPVAPVFEGQVLTSSELNKTFAGWWDDKYIVFVSLVSQFTTWDSYAGRTWDYLGQFIWDALAGSYYQAYVYHIRSDGWTRWEPAAGVSPFTFVEIDRPSTTRGLVAGSRATDGKVYRFGDPIYQDAGVNYLCRFRSREEELERSSLMKRGKLLVVEFDGAGTHDFTHYVNGDSRPVLSVVSSAIRRAYKIKGPHYFRIWQLRMDATHANPLRFYGYALHLHEKPKVIKAAT